MDNIHGLDHLYIFQKEGGLLALVEKEEETMGSCSNRYSDEMMMLKVIVWLDEAFSPHSDFSRLVLRRISMRGADIDPHQLSHPGLSSLNGLCKF